MVEMYYVVQSDNGSLTESAYELCASELNKVMLTCTKIMPSGSGVRDCLRVCRALKICVGHFVSPTI